MQRESKQVRAQEILNSRVVRSSLRRGRETRGLRRGKAGRSSHCNQGEKRKRDEDETRGRLKRIHLWSTKDAIPRPNRKAAST
jgi:hypothetical protein